VEHQDRYDQYNVLADGEKIIPITGGSHARDQSEYTIWRHVHHDRHQSHDDRVEILEPRQ